MAKSSRKRKRERAVRQARSSQKRRSAKVRQEAVEAVRLVLEQRDRILDPATPPGEAASLIAELYRGEPVSSLLAPGMLEKGSAPERLTEIAQAVLAACADDGSAGKGSASLTALTFASEAARANGDAAEARRLLDQALAAASEPEARVDLARLMSASGRDADAVELLEGRLREEPGDHVAAERYGALIGVVYDRVHGAAPRECPCGLSGSWEECCAPRERAALARFGDRTALNALQDAVRAYAAGSGFGPAIEEQKAEWLPDADDLDWEPAERDRFTALAEEAAWLVAERPGENEADEADGSGETEDRDKDSDEPGETENEDDARTVVAAFAADPSVPAGLAARAAAWRDYIHYGLWQVEEPRPEPGLWCTEIVSSVTRYAEFPPGAAEGMARWAVWLGGLVPVDGVWRCTGRGLWLSPAEADAAAELAQEAYLTLASEITGGRQPRRPRLATQPLRFGRAEPYGVYANYEERAPDVAALVISRVTLGLLPRIVNEVHTYRTTPPGLRNTDGHEMCLITARIKVDDGAQVAERLARRTDFDRDPGEPGRVVWHGRLVPDGQRAAMAAEVRAQFDAQMLPGGDVEEDSGPQRWIRGTLNVRGSEIVAEVNSRERLERLMDILARAGANPVVTDETRLEPAQDLGWPAGPRAFPRGAAPAAEGWEKHWLDEKVPALRGRTPRQAARGKERPLLEALLRQAEYEAGLLAAQGKPGMDTAWLRHELDMADDLAD